MCCDTVMSPVPLKKRKRVVHGGPLPSATLFPDVCLFLVERKMGAARRGFLTALAQRKGFCVTPYYSDTVTHVVSEQNSCSEVLAWIERQTGQPVKSAGPHGVGLHFLDISWFTESMSLGKPVVIESRHCLRAVESSFSPDKDTQIPSYACQRRTPLHHYNQGITDALEILAQAASFHGSEARYLGFTRAASVLKSLPFRLQSADDAKDLPGCGGHCKTVIQEILEDGVCREVEEVKNSEQYQSMKVLTSIFGVGTRTADRWYREGVRTLSDLQDINKKLTPEQRAGLQYYTDLQQPVTRDEAESVERLVKGALQRFIPDIQVTMTGGFRRGKSHGHDVDFLITHPDEESLTGLLRKAVDWLQSKGFLLYYHMKARSRGLHTASNTMDGHETCYAIFSLHHTDLGKVDCEAVEVDLVAQQSELAASRGWRAVRVDLVVAPYSEYYYALLGWTGSKHFERELRRFSMHEKKMSLNSHGLHDMEKRCYLPATSEEEIFTHLGLQYLPPSDRNA
ncbi:DNA-directed DNA/RNA polymerase mu-like [Rhinophrynus dorsalis]